MGPGDDPYRARYLLEQLGLTGEEKPADLSGGEARRAALAHVLAPEPGPLEVGRVAHGMPAAAQRGHAIGRFHSGPIISVSDLAR